MNSLPSTRPAAIISRNTASLASLGVTMTVMCYLAALAIAALIMVNQAVDNWNRGLAQEFTVQVKVLSAVDVEQELTKASALLEATPGVLKAEVLNKAQAMKLLEPWLGTENLDDLPVPRLIRVTINPALPPDYTILQRQLEARVKGAVLDTHGQWRDELARAGMKFSVLAIAVLVLISLGAITLAGFGARAALETNREVVDVLRLVGAENRFIARQINRRFLRLGLGAGLLGLMMALLTLFALGWLGQMSGAGLDQATIGLLPSSWRFDKMTVSCLLLVPAFSAILVTVSARVTLLRLLRSF